MSRPRPTLGPNERAILDKVPTRALRSAAGSLVLLKMRLQFTGWLQYAIPLVPTAGLALLTGLSALIGLQVLTWVFGAATALLLGVVGFDVLTVKLQLKPAEKRPAGMEDATVFEVIRERRSCRSFQTGLMQQVDRESVLSSVERRCAEPTFGPAPIRLVYVQGAMTVWPTVGASEFLVAIVPQPYDRRSILDVGRVLQGVVLDATRAGIGTCWIGPGADHDSLRAFLGDRFDPDTEHIVCTCALGYRSAFVPLFIRAFSRAFRRRLPLSTLLLDAEANPAALEESSLVPFGPAFEACRWGPSSYNGQTTRAIVEAVPAGVQMDFYAATSSRYYAPVALGIWCANWEAAVEALGLPGAFEVLTSATPDPGAEPDMRWRSV